MVPELVTSVLLGIIVFGGLAFHDSIVDCVAGIGRDPKLIDPEDVD